LERKPYPRNGNPNSSQSSLYKGFSRCQGDLVRGDFISHDSVLCAKQCFHLLNLVAVAGSQSANCCFPLEGPGGLLLLHKPTAGNYIFCAEAPRLFLWVAPESLLIAEQGDARHFFLQPELTSQHQVSPAAWG